MDNRISDVFFIELAKLMDNNPGSLQALRGENKKWGFKHFFENINCAVEITELQKEIELIIEGLKEKPQGLFIKLLSIEELIIGLKFYLISWSTMKDLIANFISTTLDLGISETDISLGLVLRNKKVKKTRIPEICKKYSKPLSISRTDSARNDAVHRGKLSDTKVLEMKQKRNRIESERYSLFQAERISEEDYKKKMTDFYNELAILVKEKKKEYTEHYNLTVALISEIAIELAHILFRQLNNERI